MGAANVLNALLCYGRSRRAKRLYFINPENGGRSNVGSYTLDTTKQAMAYPRGSDADLGLSKLEDLVQGFARGEIPLALCEDRGALSNLRALRWPVSRFRGALTTQRGAKPKRSRECLSSPLA